jgi:hypothetical protein
MPPYKELFPVSQRVRIRETEVLMAFQKSWTLHHPISDEMVSFAGTSAVVKSVGFYHGGDVLYVLENVPGTWHEGCLEDEG